MRNRALVGLFASLALAACSGGSGTKNTTEPGTNHVADTLDTDAPDPGAPAGDGGAVAANPCGPPANPCAGAGADGGVPGMDPGNPNAPLVTFELHNSDDNDIEFSYEKGWALVVSGYTGTPPNATPIILFPKFCTASCDAGEDAVCPVCEGPENAKAEREAETRQVVTPGTSFELAWDGNVHVYQKTTGTQGNKTRGCQCYTKQPVTAGNYTLRACGIRVTKSAKKTSKFQCVTTQVDLPPPAPTTVKFDFAKP